MKRLDFILQASIEEYKTLREEILLRIRLRQNLTNYSILIFTGLLTIFTIISSERFGINIGISKDIQVFILLVIPWLFFPLALLYLRHDLFIAALADCIEHRISPKIKDLLKIKNSKHIKDLNIWELEPYIHNFRKSFLQKLLAAIRYVPLLMPSLISMAYSYTIIYQDKAISVMIKYKFIIFKINIVIFIIVVLLIIFTTLFFERKITEQQLNK